MKKELTQDELIAQAVAQANKEFELKQEQRDCNLVKLGCRVMYKEVIQGKPIIDRETKEQRLDNQGKPASYPDKYKATLMFMGGEIIIDVSLNDYETLELHKSYLCSGHYGEVKVFGQAVMQPIFTQFTKI